MNILITPRAFANYGEKQVEQLEQHGFVVDYNTTGRQYTIEEFNKKAANADGIIVGVDEIDQTLIDNSPNLKVICKFGVGTDNIDVSYAETKGIQVERIIGANTNAVAEHVLAMMFLDSKNLYPVIKDVKDGCWNKPTGIELQGKTLGIVGFGAIGRNIAKKAMHLGMQVLVMDIFDIDKSLLNGFGATQVTLEKLLGKSDYVTLHMPFTKDTHHLIGLNEFQLMKESACLINTARGGIVNEQELLEALKASQIKSACFDVFSTEPPQANHPLLALDNFILTSHTAARTEDSEINTCKIAMEIMIEHLKGG